MKKFLLKPFKLGSLTNVIQPRCFLYVFSLSLEVQNNLINFKLLPENI